MPEKFKSNSQQEAWGIDEKEFANAAEFIDSRPETPEGDRESNPDEWARYDQIMEAEANAPEAVNEQEEANEVYENLSLKDLAELARDANAHNDKSTSLEAQARIEERLHKAIESGQMSEDGAMNHLDMLTKIIDSEVPKEELEEKSERTDREQFYFDGAVAEMSKRIEKIKPGDKDAFLKQPKLEGGGWDTVTEEDKAAFLEGVDAARAQEIDRAHEEALAMNEKINGGTVGEDGIKRYNGVPIPGQHERPETAPERTFHPLSEEDQARKDEVAANYAAHLDKAKAAGAEMMGNLLDTDDDSAMSEKSQEKIDKSKDRVENAGEDSPEAESKKEAYDAEAAVANLNEVMDGIDADSPVDESDPSDDLPEDERRALEEDLDRRLADQPEARKGKKFMSKLTGAWKKYRTWSLKRTLRRDPSSDGRIKGAYLVDARKADEQRAELQKEIADAQAELENADDFEKHMVETRLEGLQRKDERLAKKAANAREMYNELNAYTQELEDASTERLAEEIQKKEAAKNNE